MKSFALLVAILLFVLPSHAAFARAQVDLPYAVSEAFSTAVRFVRVDRGCKVDDKDPDAAFVSFECNDAGTIKRGMLEIFKVDGGIRAQLTLGDETHGMELRWIELFERKLRDERGNPTPQAPANKDKNPPPPPHDLGT